MGRAGSEKVHSLIWGKGISIPETCTYVEEKEFIKISKTKPKVYFSEKEQIHSIKKINPLCLSVSLRKASNLEVVH